MTSRCRRRPSRGCWIKEARRAALDILGAVRAGARFNDARDRHVSGLAERDRRLAYELAAGVLRRQQALDDRLDLTRVDPRLHDILRLGTYQLTELTRVPPYAAVSTSVELARVTAGEPAAKFVNQALRRLARAGRESTGAASSTHPDWLMARWTAAYGADGAAGLVAWNDTKPAITLQPARWSMDRLRAALQEAGFGVVEAPFGRGLRLTPAARVAPRALPGFAEGAFLVQDPAQALVCRYAAVPAGNLVYDACAAPGGKAVALERSAPRVRLIAGDARRDRLARLTETARRCGVAITVVAADLLSAPFGAATLDAVFVDAPCTATGTMARHPDARWRIDPHAFARAARRQAALLEAAARLVRRGGLLIYATCSLEPEENIAVVNEFLTRHPEFSRAPSSTGGDSVAPFITAQGDFQSLPHRDGIDGAFAARLVRAS